MKKMLKQITASAIMLLAVSTSALADPGIKPSWSDFSMFANPTKIQALYKRDYAPLHRDEVGTIVYISKIIEATEASDALFRLGQPGELLLDPRLGRILNTKLITNENLMKGFALFGLQGSGEALAPFIGKRRESVAQGTLDPIGEMTALTNGFVSAFGSVGGVMADGEYDGKVLMLMGSQTDPDRFSAIYAAIREYVYNQL